MVNLTRRLFLKLFGAAPAVALVANVESTSKRDAPVPLPETPKPQSPDVVSDGRYIYTFGRPESQRYPCRLDTHGDPTDPASWTFLDGTPWWQDGNYRMLTSDAVHKGDIVTRESDGRVRRCEHADSPVGTVLSVEDDGYCWVTLKLG